MLQPLYTAVSSKSICKAVRKLCLRAASRHTPILLTGADLALPVGGSPPVDGRLLAAARILLADSQQQLRGLSPAALCEWGAAPLGKQHEARDVAVRGLACALHR